MDKLRRIVKNKRTGEFNVALFELITVIILISALSQLVTCFSVSWSVFLLMSLHYEGPFKLCKVLLGQDEPVCGQYEDSPTMVIVSRIFLAPCVLCSLSASVCCCGYVAIRRLGKSPPKPLTKFAFQFTGAATALSAIVAVFWFLGVQLDESFDNKTVGWAFGTFIIGTLALAVSTAVLYFKTGIEMK